MMAMALNAGDLSAVKSMEAHHSYGRNKRGRPRKGFRSKDRDPDRHERLQRRHMTSLKAQTGMTGKQLRKQRKRAMKARMRLTGTGDLKITIGGPQS